MVSKYNWTGIFYESLISSSVIPFQHVDVVKDTKNLFQPLPLAAILILSSYLVSHCLAQTLPLYSNLYTAYMIYSF